MPLSPRLRFLPTVSDSLTRMLGLLFLPAVLGLSIVVLHGYEGCSWLNVAYCPSHSSRWPVRILALGTVLISLEQARMAIVDLQNIQITRQQVQSSQLDRFYGVTLSTIAIELVGFYLGVFWIGWGALLVLVSQVWFNLFANVQLHPASANPVEQWGVCDRIPVLLADCVGLLLVSLWLSHIAAVPSAALLLAIVLIYGGVKYLQPQKMITG